LVLGNSDFYFSYSDNQTNPKDLCEIHLKVKGAYAEQAAVLFSSIDEG
jgi:hypothetical protein